MVPTGLVEERANRWKISLRTGCFCNPGAFECIALVSSRVMNKVMKEAEEMGTVRLVTGSVRVSLGIVSNFADCYYFYTFCLSFIDNNFLESIKLSVLRSKKKYDRLKCGKAYSLIIRNPQHQDSRSYKHSSHPPRIRKKMVEIPDEYLIDQSTDSRFNKGTPPSPRISKKMLEIPDETSLIIQTPQKQDTRSHKRALPLINQKPQKQDSRSHKGTPPSPRISKKMLEIPDETCNTSSLTNPKSQNPLSRSYKRNSHTPKTSKKRWRTKMEHQLGR